MTDKAISSFDVNEKNIAGALNRNPILITALNRIIGYEQAAKIAKTAYQKGRPVVDVANDMTDLFREELLELIDPAKLTFGGI